MEAVILCGVQGAGKTTLYRDRFLETHVRVAMDLLRTRAREEAFVRLCLRAAPAVRRRRHQPDPGRPPSLRRAGARGGFKVVGYVVEIADAQALARNAARSGRGACRPPRWWARPGACCARRPRRASTSCWHAAAAADGGWRIEPLLTTPPLF